MMWQALIPAVTAILEKVLPDPQAKDEAKLKLLELAQKGELAQLDADVRLALGQLEVNKTEAASGSVFVSGWRPGAGWVCVLGLGYQFLLQPFLVWASRIYGWEVPPMLDVGDLLTLLGGMLGLGGLRTAEKFKRVARS
jgi:hypothetical protein